VTYFLTPEAEVELAEAVDFYALNASPKVARNFLALFEEKALLLSEFPSMGHPLRRGGTSFQSVDTHTGFSIVQMTGSFASAPLLTLPESHGTGRAEVRRPLKISAAQTVSPNNRMQRTGSA
jgi:plasmid stabilization system protein ParE